MSYQLEFNLKQHTPLIHFQHNQQGATLRATELKPKLDQFIIEHFLEENNIPWNYEAEARRKFKEITLQQGNNISQKNWLINDSDSAPAALNYKVKIVAKNNKSELIEKNDRSYPLFFANMGDEYDKNPMCLKKSDHIIVTFLVLNDSLREIIFNVFPKFISRTNFGTRQNKGYGSFYFHPDDSNDFGSIDKYLPNDTCYLEFEGTNWENKIGLVIQYYYSRLKAGLSYNNHNKPSFLKEYAKKSLKKTWEKTWIKDRFFIKNKKYKNPAFVRALLGLIPKFWYQNNRSIRVEHANNQIRRAKSPITFKPITDQNEKKTKVFIIPENYYREPLLGEEFKFSDGNKNENLKTPDQDIDLNKLVTEYHNTLHNQFQARDFSGNRTVKVSIKKI